MRPATGEVPVRVRAEIDLTMAAGGRTLPGRVHTFTGLPGAEEHLVVAVGPYRRPRGGVPLVRLHSECLTGDVFGSRRCDCGPQLDEALVRIAEHGGYLVYLRQEGRGIGLYAKLDAYRLQDQGLDTFEANRALGYPEDARGYEVAGRMLRALDVLQVDLMTGNPQKAAGLAAGGVAVRRTLPTALHETTENLRYLHAKRRRGFRFAGDHGSLSVS
ncbi:MULTISPECIES: GTP cyclohydrolase II RibA [unclassified Nocardioides]|uniref:GTP cyclohydrolase II RibA n=1 Tax=unclassified Nocardioides TaxID=2615069 RepID=UPI0000571285|nr:MULTISPECIES: GTP cyclohydrolase II RibA [unclassified Nocardioides]ABL80389.1 GTP cyclohydrolase II [Nocardioides sp. JS614]